MHKRTSPLDLVLQQLLHWLPPPIRFRLPQNASDLAAVRGSQQSYHVREG